MSTNDYTVDKSKSLAGSEELDLFAEPYAWLEGKTVERGLVNNGRRLIWMWYRWDGKRRKPDVRHLRSWTPKGEKSCFLTLEVPDDKILLIDSEAWCCRINNISCNTREENQMDSDEFEKVLEDFRALPAEEQQRRMEASWELVFDEDPDGFDLTEAVMYGLDRSMIKSVQFFEGTFVPE